MSAVRNDNEKLRIDDGFFSKLAVFAQKQVETLPHVRLGVVCSTFRKGIFDIKAESYVDYGIPFVRIGDLRHGLIDDSGLAFISEDVHAQEFATALVRGDVILSKTAYAAASLVNVPNCNVSQDTIAVKIAPAWRKKLLSGFLVVFLNTKYGRALMSRQFQGNVQAHLSLPDGRKLPVPLFEANFQKQVQETILKADSLLATSKSEMAGAEQTLLEALGLEGWEPPEPLTYTRHASEVLSETARLDAEHWREKFYAARETLKTAGAHEFIPMEHLLVALTNGQTPLHHDLTVGEVPFLCAEHVSNFEVVYTSEKRVLLKHHNGQLARTALKNGDIVMTIKGRVGNAAIVENVPGAVNINQDVALMRLNERFPHWFVVAFLNSFFGKLAVEQHSTGAINPFLGLFNIRRLLIPRFDRNLMEKIGEQTREQVQLSRAARQEALALLAKVKYAVEIAIEEGEGVGLKFLEEN